MIISNKMKIILARQNHTSSWIWKIQQNGISGGVTNEPWYSADFKSKHDLNKTVTKLSKKYTH